MLRSHGLALLEVYFVCDLPKQFRVGNTSVLYKMRHFHEL